MELHSLLSSSDSAAVASGTFRGTPAVIKLYDSRTHGRVAWENELAAYDRLFSLQQEGVIPTLLGAGHLLGFVPFIATTTVLGTPLSQLTRLGPHIAAAALSALNRLHSISGFLHGDLHLGNVLLLQAPGGGDTAARCVILDFGASQLDTAADDQEQERKRLERLLRM
jgi:hypothetical protein